MKSRVFIVFIFISICMCSPVNSATVGPFEINEWSLGEEYNIRMHQILDDYKMQYGIPEPISRNRFEMNPEEANYSYSQAYDPSTKNLTISASTFHHEECMNSGDGDVSISPSVAIKDTISGSITKVTGYNNGADTFFI